MTVDPHTLVRAGSVYIAALLTAGACFYRLPDRRVWAGAVLAASWNVPALLALNLAAQQVGWWTFDADGGVWLGIPVDLLLAWVWLWGVVPVLLLSAAPLAVVVGLALALDLGLMPAAAPVVRLGPQWLVGELVALLAVLLPGQLLARWTIRGERLEARALIQMVAFAGFLVLVLPAAAIDGSGAGWRHPLTRPAWQLAIIVQLLACPAVLGLTAVQEFVTRGRGTPVPFDPPQRLVTSGIYGYVRSPMQLSAMLLLCALAVVLANGWIAAAAVGAHVYAAGIASLDEEEDLRGRFGDAWLRYRSRVPRWLPTFRPPLSESAAGASLFVSTECGMCRQVGQWFASRGARGLAIVPAESHPRGGLTRITYEMSDGSYAATGIDAIGRALEHIHAGWAYVSFIIRLPVVRPVLQIIVDGSGGYPREIRRERCSSR